MKPQYTTKQEGIKKALKLKYNIRFNEITAKLEYGVVGTDEYSEVTNDVMKSFKNELKENGIDVTKADIIGAFSSDVFKRDDNTNDDKVRCYIQTILESRFNVVKTRVEYRTYDDNSGTWKTLDDYFINSLVHQIKSYGYKTSNAALRCLFLSDFSPKINPLCQYFEELPEYEGNPIHELAETVKVKNAENWEYYLTKWLVATLANCYNDEKCTNQTMLILCGEQGCGKTTWIEHLIPNALRRYLYSGKLDIDKDKDTNATLAENLIVNLDDQMKDLLTKRGAESIKNVISKNYITYRRPYDVQPTDYPRIASLIGSINGIDFLNDPTGSRRYLPFEVEWIDLDTTRDFDMDRVWKQAYELYKSGYRYFFNQEEIAQLNKNNEMFAIMTLEEELILKYYTPSEEYAPGSDFVTNVDIVNFIMTRTPYKILETKIYDALKKNGFVRTRRRVGGGRQYGYFVKFNDFDEDPLK